jgi:DNA ligase-4
MIVYYDLLMVDNESLLAVKHSERFQRLKDLITQVPGRSALVKREVIDCSRPSAASDLRRALAHCITRRGEGLVLKADDPYFNFGTLRRSCAVVKLKKEYIGCFGDVGDFAVVGSRYDTSKARTYNIRGLKWTHFYVGCLENKEEVQRFGKQPRFVVTNVVELNAAQLETFITFVNPESVAPEDNTAIALRIEPGIDNGKRPSLIFPNPPVFDIRCFSFDKVGNTGFWSPRFPSVSKIHYDRSYRDIISFAELQAMAAEEKEMPPPEDSQELLGWIATLERAEPTTVSQSTVSTMTEQTPSPQKPTSPDCRRDVAAPISPTKEKVGPKKQAQVAPVAGQLTPPRSSATKMPEPTSSKLTTEQEDAALGRKRSLEWSTENSIPKERKKIRRCTSDRVHASTNLTEEQRVGPPMTLSRRNTESHVAMAGLSSTAPAQKSNLEKENAQERGPTRSSFQTSVSFRERASTSFSAEASSNKAKRFSAEGVVDTASRPAEVSTETATRTGTCRYLGDACKLATYSIILSPCISSFPWVTEDLLSCHGVFNFERHHFSFSASIISTLHYRRRRHEHSEEDEDCACRCATQGDHRGVSAKHRGSPAEATQRRARVRRCLRLEGAGAPPGGGAEVRAEQGEARDEVRSQQLDVAAVLGWTCLRRVGNDTMYERRKNIG